MLDDNCPYCGHPKHRGGERATITRDRALELWRARGPHWSIQPTAAECETIRYLWDRAPGSYSYSSTFNLIRQVGSDAAEKQLPAAASAV